MTQAQTHTRVVGGSPLIQLLLEAVLCAFVSLVQGVAATLGMIGQNAARDWHTHREASALPQAKLDTSQEGLQTSQPSFSGKREARIPRTSVASTRGHANTPHALNNQSARHKAERDSVDPATPEQEADPSVRVPREGGDPVLREAQTPTVRTTSTLTRADQPLALIGSVSKDAGDTVDRLARAR